MIKATLYMMSRQLDNIWQCE